MKEEIEDLKKRVNKIENILLNIKYNNDLFLKILMMERKLSDIYLNILRNEKKIEKIEEDDKDEYSEHI